MVPLSTNSSTFSTKPSFCRRNTLAHLLILGNLQQFYVQGSLLTRLTAQIVQATLQPNIDIGCQFMDVAFIQVGEKHILKHEGRLFFRLQLFAGRQQRQVAQPYPTSKKRSQRYKIIVD